MLISGEGFSNETKFFIYSVATAAYLSLFFTAQDYSSDIQKYLEPGKFINSDHPTIVSKTIELVGDETNPVRKAKILFEFVRDEIREGYVGSMKASDVLTQGEGVCHEKASLLTALARSAGIPAYYGFTVIQIKNWRNKEGKITDIKFLHGATGLYLNGKWILYDPTGNIHRWKIWVQDDPITIALPLESSDGHDVIFPSAGRVNVKRTSYHLIDYDLNELKRIGKLYGIDY